MSHLHAVRHQRDQHEWAMLYARSYGELTSYVESLLDGTLELSDVEKLYRAHSKRHYDEVEGKVPGPIEELRPKPPE